MNITKIGHCCLLVEEGSARLMTDPGVFSRGYEQYENVHAILITHEHADHCHTEGIKAVIAKNPKVTVYTNHAVAPILDEAGIEYTLVADNSTVDVEGVSIEAYEYDHEEIHPRLETVRNTGFLIGKRFYYGGDALKAPEVPIEILAVPVAAPWMRIRESIDFCLRIKPKRAFPVHDGILVSELGGSHKAPGIIFAEEGIEWIIPKLGEPMIFEHED